MNPKTLQRNHCRRSRAIRQTMPAAWRVETLEPRTLLAFGALGPEFLVNTTTAGNQYGPALAADPLGNFVVAWAGPGQDPTENEVYARRFDADGEPLGGEFVVNTTTAGQQHPAGVASDAAGGFAVVWMGNGADGAGVYVRRFDADGTPRGGERRANVDSGLYGVPAVATDAHGNLIVAWSGGQDVFARRFDAAGQPVAAEFVVSQPADPSGMLRWRTDPSVAMDADGDFTVAWHDQVYGMYGLLYSEVRMRRYDAGAVPTGSEMVVSPDGSNPSVAMDADGDCLVTWNAYLFEPFLAAQRFNPSGDPVGESFFVSYSAVNSTVALGGDASFVVTWTQWDGSFSAGNIYGQRYGASNQPLGDPFRVNQFNPGEQVSPIVAASAGGGYVVAWESLGQDGSGLGVYGQRCGEGGLPPPPAPPTLTVHNISVAEGNTGTANAVFTVSLSAPSADVISVDYATADYLARAGADYVAASGTLTFAPGETSKPVAVAVSGDGVDEFDENFLLTLSNSVNADLAQYQAGAVIVDDDAPPTITINDVSVREGRTGTTALTFTVSLSAPSEKTVRASFSTANGTATVANADYVAASGTLVFAAGQTTKTVTVQVVGDKRKEADEYFFVNLFNVLNALVGDGQARGTILNDD